MFWVLVVFVPLDEGPAQAPGVVSKPVCYEPVADRPVHFPSGLNCYHWVVPAPEPVGLHVAWGGEVLAASDQERERIWPVVVYLPCFVGCILHRQAPRRTEEASEEASSGDGEG